MSKGKITKFHTEDYRQIKTLKSALQNAREKQYNSTIKGRVNFESTTQTKGGKRADSRKRVNKTPSKTFDICTADSDTVFTMPSCLVSTADAESKATSRRRNASKSVLSKELEDFQKEIPGLRVKLLEKKEGEHSDSHLKDSLKNNEKRTQSKLKKQKSLIDRVLLLKLKKNKEDVKNEILKQLRVTRKKENKAKEIEDFYLEEIETIKEELTEKANARVSSVKKEFERNLNRIQEENFELKKQNEKIMTQLGDALARRGTREGSKIDCKESEKELRDLKDKYNKLQRDYMEVRKEQSEVLCSKCKAFTKVNQDLAGKIETLKKYLN